MAVPGADPTLLRYDGPGYLFMAPLGSTLPTDLTTAWDAAWVPLGYTAEGSTFSIEPNFESITVAEELEEIDVVETGRIYTINYALAQITAANLQAAQNGGTITTGTGIVTYTPPVPGDVTHRMLGWESVAGDERIAWKKCVQTGNVSIARQKAPNMATIPQTWRAVKPDDASEPYVWIMEDAA